MNRIAVELLKVARELLSMEFDTEEEKKKYQEEHDVRPGTKLEVKKQEQKKQTPSQKPKIEGLSVEEYAALYGGPIGWGQGIAHFYNYGSSKQKKDKKFYDEFIDGKGGIKQTLEAESARAKSGDKESEKNVKGLQTLLKHVESERKALG